MRKKIFTFLLALAASVGMSWAETSVTFLSSDLSDMNVGNGGVIASKNCISFLQCGTGGKIIYSSGARISLTSVKYGRFVSSAENITKVEISCTDIGEFSNNAWSYADGNLTWTGEATSVTLNSSSSANITGVSSITVYYDAPADPTYTVAGDNATIFGNTWAADEANNDMTLLSGDVYMFTKSVNFSSNTSIEFKVCKDHGWDTNYPSDNFICTIPSGQHTLLITFNASTLDVMGYGSMAVAGSNTTLFGTSWDPSNTANDMTMLNDYTFKFEKEHVTLSAGTIEFKAVSNHNWGHEWPSSNYQLNIPESGDYTVTITFNPATLAVNATATLEQAVVVIPTIQLHSNIKNEDWESANFTPEEGNETATLALTNVAKGNYSFGIKIDGTWTSNGSAFTRTDNSKQIVSGSGDCSFTADIPGNYTFTWTYADNTLSIGYPDLVEYVEGLIAAIGEVNLESASAINAARTAYDDLLDADQKQAVNNYDVLTGAEAAYALLHDQVAANTVKNLIDAIDNPVVYTQACKDKIDAARNAYEALTNAQKTLVGDEYAQKLADAEAAYIAFIKYTVAGMPSALFGTEWDPENTANDMTLQPNGTYLWEKEGAELAKGSVAFKVCKDHAWAISYPNSNYVLAIPEDGIYTITITFNPAAEGDKVSGVATKTGDAVIAHTAQMKGIWDEWTDAVNYVDNGDGTATVSKRFAATGDYTFKVIIDGGWRGESNTFTRDNNEIEGIVDNTGDMKLTVDVPGCYTFTWNFESNKLTVAYPSLTIDVAAIVNNQAGTIVLPAEQVEGTQLNFGVAADGSRVEADAPNALMTVTGSFKNEHGMQSPTFTVMVPGSVDIYVGKCTYSTKTINVRNANNELVVSKTPTAACWKTDHANMTVLHYEGVATTLTISGMDFCPYIRVKTAPVLDPMPAYINVQAQVNNQAGTLLTSAETAAQGNAVSLGVNAANERVAADAANAIMTVAGNYHSEHGLTNAVFTVRVPGNVDIYVGECDYSATDIIVKDEDNNIVTSLTPAATACWKNDHNNVAVLHYVGGANTLTISGMQYCPYVCVKSTPVDVPSEIDIQAIVNNDANTLLEESELVQYTSVNFGVAADGNRVASDNPSAILYVAGQYHSEHGLWNPTFTVRVPGEVEIYVGECTYSTATIEVRNAANELVDSKTPEDVCWKNNPDNVAVLHYTGEATTLTISGMTYCPFIRVKTPTAPVQITIGDANNGTEIETFLTNNNGQTIDELIIDRPVLNNMYNTLCLPFDMDAAQIAASSLNGVEIREFTGASVDGTTLNLSVGDPVNAVVAGRPYFVKYSAASQLDDLHFEGVTINNAILDDEAVTFDGVTFKGTFTPFVMPNGLNFQGGYLFLGQNNQLFWPNTSNPLKPFRAYFYVDVESSTPGNAPKYRGMPARIVEGKNVVTGMDNVQGDNVQCTKVLENGVLYIIKNDVRYNVQGQVIK